MDILEVIQYSIPALIVFATAFLLIYYFFKNDEKRRQHELYVENKKISLPVRLQAYERLILLLERLSPESLLIRVKRQGMTSGSLQKELLKTIRAEFEHNLSQQLYVSNDAWEVLVAAKENIVQLINTSMIEIPRDKPAMELSQMILESMLKTDIHSPHAAIKFLKKEAAILF